MASATSALPIHAGSAFGFFASTCAKMRSAPAKSRTAISPRATASFCCSVVAGSVASAPSTCWACAVCPSVRSAVARFKSSAASPGITARAAVI